ncbi:MAG: hypothetical protein JRG94_20940 [Deltaproteobacteria bacterium]|nr:hypothetical protein [Deltaproteobacteria bacterium]
MFALMMIAGLSARAQNPCAVPEGSASEVQLAQSDSGLSGTGRAGGDESGLGGTGLRGSEESGIGGTGYSGGDGDEEESGIGGTGVFGTITAFGSICVNGLRIHYDDETPITLDGKASTTGALAIGQRTLGRAGIDPECTDRADHAYRLHRKSRKPLERDGTARDRPR